MRWTEEMHRVLRERYSDEDNAVLARELGVSMPALRNMAQRLGLRKSKAYESARRRRLALECGNASRLNTPEAIDRRVAAMKRQYEVERIRLSAGLEQKTKRHLRLEPRGRLLQRNRLRRLGYVVDEKALVAYWTESTHRATRLEKLKRGEKKGSLKCWYDFAELKEK